MTIQDVNDRNFTYCCAVLNKEDDDSVSDGLRQLHFLVPYGTLMAARLPAFNYAKDRWEKDGWKLEKVRLYPRNYVRDARKLFANGDYAQE